MTESRSVPIRRRSANGQPKPETFIERTCSNCGASFIGLAFGDTGQRGIWRSWTWYCSMECDARGERKAARRAPGVREDGA